MVNNNDLNKSSEEILTGLDREVNEGHILADSGDYVFIDDFEVKIGSIKEVLLMKNIVSDIIKTNHKSEYEAFSLYNWVKSSVPRTKKVKRKGVETEVVKSDIEYSSQVIALIMKHKIDKEKVENYFTALNYYNKIVFVNHYIKGFIGLSIDETIEKLNSENSDKSVLVENLVDNVIDFIDNVEKLETVDNEIKRDILNKSTGLDKKVEVDDFRK